MLLSPLALVALAALAIPAILHLWRPPPATVRVGTLKFFTGPAVRRLTKLRWRERLLLAVRLLLLALLALLLAQPIWRNSPPTTPQRWALIERGVVLHGEAQKRWRELENAGYATRTLLAGFPAVAPDLTRTGQQSNASDVWSLLRELDARLPAGSAIAVFTSNRLAFLRGERPVMYNSGVEWLMVEPNESSDTAWISAIHPTRTSAELQVVLTTSNATRSENISAVVPAAPGKTALASPLNGWSVEIAQREDSRLAARLVRDDGGVEAGSWLPVSEGKPLNIALLHAADRRDDARYLDAALRAAAEASGRDIVVGTDAARADWAVWLNDQPPPAELVAEVTSRGATLLSDAENSREQMLPVLTSIEADGLHERVALFRRVPPAAESGAVLWSDGFGTPLLLIEQQQSGRRLRFFSRFHPEWNDLPHSSALAAALQPLLLPREGAIRDVAQQDQRRADASQGPPADAASTTRGTSIRLPAPAETVDLHRALWLMCVALFALERVLSHLGRRTRPAARQTPTVATEQPAYAEHV